MAASAEKSAAPSSNGQEVAKRPGLLSSWISNLTGHENFRRFARFGLVDQSFLIIGLLSGFQLDSVFTKYFGVRGYGPVLGAAFGNCAADVIASTAEGGQAAAGIMIGTLLPISPLIGAMAFKVPLQGRAQYVIGGICVGIIGATFYNKSTPDHELSEESSSSTK
eukprot:TRINITY_DN13428_c0_g1_i1.p1 TRINITY_DN13428_c0_g1~~TRINITY_DN13428_c0_g1_i1.p1  ORF type:complete len:178 (-),score=15.65 TRINITY_DN13428_c0_g1_i1:99-593(-)